MSILLPGPAGETLLAVLATLIRTINGGLASTPSLTAQQVTILQKVEADIVRLQADVRRWIAAAKRTPPGGRKHRAALREFDTLKRRGQSILQPLDSIADALARIG